MKSNIYFESLVVYEDLLRVTLDIKWHLPFKQFNSVLIAHTKMRRSSSGSIVPSSLSIGNSSGYRAIPLLFRSATVLEWVIY